MMVTEPKVENSGIPQGTFVKRHRIPKPEELGGGYYSYEDLRCGMTIMIYSRSFRIVDCDDFTRSFYAGPAGLDAGPPEEMPVDTFHASETQRCAEWTPGIVKRDVAETKEYTELSHGGNRRNAKLEQFLENDRKVLSFKCYWDDPTRYGTRQYYTLNYYLADDTVEIYENQARNSGRDPYPIFWGRAPLRKNPYVCSTPGMLQPEPIICKPEEFIIGQSVPVYGRKVFLFDCDEFTSDFYRKYMGIEQGKIELKSPEHFHFQLAYPPHIGFGTEEDSMASCLHLTPRAPKRDMIKMMDNATKVMRFEGRLLTHQAGDNQRKFIIVVHLADDSVSVWEMRQRNSGQAEGRFAVRSRKRNVATGEWFCPQDFFLGAKVEINCTPFLIVCADEGTLKYMEQNCQDFCLADATAIANKISGLKAEFSEKYTVEPADLRQMCVQSLGIYLCDHELVTLIRAFGVSEKSGFINVEKLARNFS